MKAIDAFRVIESLQGDSVVVVCQEGRVPWESLGPNLDLYIPFVGSMGKGHPWRWEWHWLARTAG